jgi:ParB family chromosome partitioning protein
MKAASQPEKKLGRGLSALLGDSKSKSFESAVAPNGSGSKGQVFVDLVVITQIVAGIYQPRRIFDEVGIKELADSIKENGLLQPITLRKSDEGQYEIIAGERRFRAAKLLGLKEIPAIIKKVNNHEALELALVENVQRSDLSLMEEADGYKQLMEEFSYTQEQVAKKTGKSRSHIANILRLLDLPESVRKMVDQKQLSMGHARAIINSKDPEALARKIIDEQLTVRDIEDEVRSQKVDAIKENPSVAQRETSVKFVNSAELSEIENKLSDLMDSKVRISFNQFQNRGKITISFEGLETVYGLVSKMES